MPEAPAEYGERLLLEERKDSEINQAVLPQGMFDTCGMGVVFEGDRETGDEQGGRIYEIFSEGRSVGQVSNLSEGQRGRFSRLAGNRNYAAVRILGVFTNPSTRCFPSPAPSDRATSYVISSSRPLSLSDLCAASMIRG